MIADIFPDPVTEILQPAVSKDVAVATPCGIAGGVVVNTIVGDSIICILLGDVKSIGAGMFRNAVEFRTGYIMNRESFIRLYAH